MLCKTFGDLLGFHSVHMHHKLETNLSTELLVPKGTFRTAFGA